jgi:hypothetical protein
MTKKILSKLVNICCFNAVLERQSYKGGSINLEKSKFLAEAKVFVSHPIGKGGLTATNKEISAMREYKKPTPKKEM